ncbi:protein arginine N-methyltransferase 2 [Herrania umbratica]|uniref:Protein arginine N-methyltransferase 2 n=1 Tax=Herrania umbratica TaxID=108875 RepID=A0A6J1A921_9ROSI|nr:protein arginine N-methyltransferase 2 [Herrania umbratica]
METEGEQLCEAARNGNVDKVKTLIESGADASYFDSDGLTPLMHAAKLGHTDVIRALLEAGAPWNALSPANQSAGDFAMDSGHQEAIEVLVNAGIQAELILGTIARKTKKTGDSEGDYLEDRVSFSEDKLMDSDSKAVMMAWEKPLMAAHAKAVCSGGGNILNVGFGMGLVDAAIQQYGPATHTIIEAHPEVYERMLRTGWGKKDNVKIIFGRWQDVLSELESYDGIFFDTYGEYYEDLREFHQHLPKLLKPGGIYSFFNGLCGGNAFFHVVYCHLVSLELENLGYSTQLIPLPVKDCLGEEVWQGVRHKYWQLDMYYLPVCQSLQDPE